MDIVELNGRIRAEIPAVGAMRLEVVSVDASHATVRIPADGNGNDNVIGPNELCKISFEVRNNTSKTIYNIRPQVYETSGNRHISVSQGIFVEQIKPNRGIRYTAMVKADSRLRDGTATFRVSVDNPATGHSVEINDIQIMTRN